MATATTVSITAATVTITANKPGRRPRAGRRGGTATALAVGGAGLALLLCGAIRLAAGVTTLEARAVLWDVFAGKDVPQADLQKAAEGIDRAARWVADNELQADRTLMLLHAASQAAPAERSALVEAAERNAEDTLARAPGQPTTWHYLASMRERRQDTDGTVSALRLSMLSGPFAPPLMIARTAMGVRHLAAIQGDDRLIFKRQVRLTWLLAPDLVAMLKYNPEMRVLIDEALRDLTDDEIARGYRNHGHKPD